MEFPVQTNSLPTSYWERHKRLFLITLITGALASATILYLFYGGWARPSPGKTYVVKVGLGYATDVYTLGPGDTELRKFAFTQNPTQAPPVDVVRTSDGSWYYILAEKVEPVFVTNVYIRKTDGSDTKITNSDTMKYALQVAPNGSLVFQEKKVKNITEYLDQNPWDIVYVPAGVSEQQKIATGTRPQFIKGSSEILYVSGSELKAYAIADTSTHTLTTLSGLFAVDSSGNTLAIVNNITHKLDIFTILGNSTISYKKSLDAPSASTALTILGDLVTFAYTKNEAGKTAFVLVDSTTGMQTNVAPPARQLPIQQAHIQSIYTYE